MLFHPCLYVLTLLATVTNAVAVEKLATTQDPEWVEAKWEIEYRPGVKGTFTGTAQQVFAQLLEANPNYETEMADTIAANNQAASVLLTDAPQHETPSRRYLARAALAKRDHSECDAGGPVGGACPTRHIRAGIRYLNSIGGQPSLGSFQCSRVSCSYSSSISWCNVTPGDFTLPSFGWIAGAASVIVDECPTFCSVGQGVEDCTLGTRYHHDGQIRVYVRSDPC